MAKYNPFAEKAGMRRIAEQPPSKEALKIATALKELGFNLQLLGSTNYVLDKLRTLGTEDVAEIKKSFVKNPHTRFLKAFSFHLPFGTKEAYEQEIAKANLDKLSSLIKICGFLMQTKVYLFWSMEFWH